MSITRLALAKQYTHIQTVPSDLWDINFKIDMVPITEVLVYNNGVLEKIIPQTIERISTGHIKIYFSEPYYGEAHLVG